MVAASEARYLSRSRRVFVPQFQTAFVDQPQDAVKQADGLVEEVIGRVTEGLSSCRSLLEDQWARGEDVSTEDLRLTLQGYRSFFEHMLSTELR